MLTSDARNWLGKYFLTITASLGGYILLFAGTPLLPIERSEAMASFQIIVPVLIGQLTVIYRFFGAGKHDSSKDDLDVPDWIIKAPPLVVGILVTSAVGALIAANLLDRKEWAPSADTFRAIVTFCVALLNATTIFLVGRYFPTVTNNATESGLAKGSTPAGKSESRE